GEVSAVALDEKAPAADRLTAVRTLGLLLSKEAVEHLTAALKTGSEPLRLEAVQSLGRIAQQKANSPGQEQALKALQDQVTGDAGPAVQQAALTALAGSHPGTVWLLELYEKKQLPEKLIPETARLLRNTPFQDLKGKALAAFPPPGRLDPKK